MNRDWLIGEALSSYRRLCQVLSELSEKEIKTLLEIEKGSKRRKTHIERLQSRLNVVQFNRLKQESLNAP